MMGIRVQFFLVAGLVFFLANSVRTAAATSENLNVGGDVSSELSISVQPNAVASSLNLTTNGSETIATVVETCNDPDGYVVTVSSANGVAAGASSGLLVGSSAGESFAYILHYQTFPSALTWVSGVATVTDSSAKTPSGGIAKSVFVELYPAGENLAADTYTDTLTFTIAAK